MAQRLTTNVKATIATGESESVIPQTNNPAVVPEKKENIVELDDERRAAMVSNLLVVLCSSSHTQPVVNTGTLYN